MTGLIKPIAKQLSYTPAGSGAVARTIYDKLGEVVSVKDFGAKGDGIADDTAAFQSAIYNAGIGRSIYVPKGNYNIFGQLVLLQNQKLVGETTLACFGNNLYTNATTLNIKFGANDTSTAFLLLDKGSGVHGICFNYPDQIPDWNPTPVPYGWTISTNLSRAYTIDDITIRDVMLVNSYMGINLDNAGRWNVQNVYGDTMLEGIRVDRAYDVCRMMNVHIYPFTNGGGTGFFTWINKNGRAFNFNRVDECECFGLFQYGRNVGFDFNDNGNGGFWGNFYGCMSDIANFPVRINQVERLRWYGGTLIPTAYTSPVAEAAITTSSNITVNNSLVGQPHVVFDGVQFHDAAFVGAVIKSANGNFVFNNCDFEKVIDGIAVINTSTAYVDVNNPKTRFSTNSRLTVLGDGKYTRFNGIPNPALNLDVTPANFNMSTWTSGKPDNWNLIVGTPTSAISNLGGGVVRLLYNKPPTACLQYVLPTSITQRKGIVNVSFNIRFSGVTDGVVVIHNRKNDATNTQSRRVFSGYNHTDTYTYVIPIVLGYEPGYNSIDIEWYSNSATTSSTGYAEISNLKIYECDGASLKQDVIDSIYRREFLDPYGYGPAISKPGSNRVIHQATAAPTAGTWKVADQVKNYPPTVGQPKSWVCTIAGTPGTWVSEGNL